MPIDILGNGYDPQIMPSLRFHTAVDTAIAAVGLRDSKDPSIGMLPGHGSTLLLMYATADAYAARVSADVEALRSLPGFALVESWTAHAAPLVVCLRYVAATVADVPRPIAPAPVPASPSRRR